MQGGLGADTVDEGSGEAERAAVGALGGLEAFTPRLDGGIREILGRLVGGREDQNAREGGVGVAETADRDDLAAEA